MSFQTTTKQGLVRAFILAFLAALPFAVGAADHAARKAQFESRLASVKALSSALARDAGADRAEVKAAITKVAARQKEAEELAAVGEYDAARLILDEGYALLSRTLVTMKAGKGYSGPSGAAAAAAAASGEQDTVRRLAAFDNRMMSAKAMAAALKRQNQEKSAGKDAAIDDIESRLRQAETLRGGNITAAQGLLDQAFEATKLALQSMQTPTQMSSSAPAEAGVWPAVPRRSGQKSIAF